MQLPQRVFLCECGNRLDRDYNTAINIMLRFLSRHALWTSYQQRFVGNLRHFFDTQSVKRKLSPSGVGTDSQEASSFRG
ncbi:MAG: zinc ribbon domain-containing protein [Candidatus Hermodarchaeota archaeon]